MTPKTLWAGGCLLSFSLPLVCAEHDAVREAIERFENSRRKPPTEVTVVLEPPPPPAVPMTEHEKEAPAVPQEAVASEEAPAQAPSTPPTTAPAAMPQPIAPPATEPSTLPLPEASIHPTPPPTGIAISVRTIAAGEQPVDAAAVKILAPFPAKPLAKPPAGWRIEPSEQAMAFTEDVKLEHGHTVTLRIKPHVLVPDSDGFLSFTVPEPGFDPQLEYDQNATIGAVLARSIEQLDEDSKQLGTALDQLEQFLISLPKPKAQPVSTVEP